ncbi:MAG: GGDEF domain-containing protein, partial [Methylophilaceae bacterium]
MANPKLPNTLATPVIVSDIARKTIKQMAMQSVAPTPDNYQRIYNEIAGISATETLHDAISHALKQLPRDTGKQEKWIASWKRLLAESNWAGLPALMAESLDNKIAHSEQWPTAIRELLRQWDAQQAGLNTQSKKDALDRVLNNFGNDPQLAQKIQAMAKGWAGYGSSTAGSSTVPLVDEIAPAVIRSATAAASQAQQVAELSVAANSQTALLQDNLRVVQDMLCQSLTYGLMPRLEGYPDLKAEAHAISVLSAKSQGLDEWQAMATQLKALLERLALIGNEGDGLQQDLLRLLKLLIDNISELVSDDQWIRGQIAMVQTIISNPLEKALINEAEKSLKEVILKQGALKHNLTEAKNTFKQMVTTFIDRLSTMTDSTGAYQSNVENYADQLSKTDDMAQINVLLKNLLQDTRMMHGDILLSHEALVEQRNQAAAAEEKIHMLEQELSQLSEKVRIDQLTGTLNRHGLDEAFVQEIARAKRGKNALSVALLDIDNFKRLNDTRGHGAGDTALQHLAAVIKDTVRPTDVVARLGGEEFVVLLPDTAINKAADVISRLQRELTKKFFMHNNDRLLITFSAGIALFKL